MVNETALSAINKGSKAITQGELANVAEDTPNNDAMGEAQTPIHAPLLQHESKTGAADVRPPVMLVQIDFLLSILTCFLL